MRIKGATVSSNWWWLVCAGFKKQLRMNNNTKMSVCAFVCGVYIRLPLKEQIYSKET